MRKVKRLFAGMAAFLIAAISFLPCKAEAISAEKAIVLDAATGRVLFERNANSRSLIASTTKIMTGLVVCEQCNVLDRVRIPKEAVGIEGSSLYLKEGEVLTVQELLYGMMLHSGNDAATALAIYCGGTVEGFAELMNDKARNLGLADTHFVNPHGLDAPDHYSTARDLAVLTAYAMENPIFYRTVSTKNVTVGNRCLRNHNKLLWRVDGADGVKTGFTKAAGRILVSSATRQGRRLITVTINAPNDWADHAQLLEKGFSEFSVKEILKENQLLGVADVAGGESQQVQLLAGSDFSYPIGKNEKVEITLPKPGFVYAPVSEGQEAGEAWILLNGKPVGKVPLRYGETIAQEQEELPFWKRILG